MISKALMLALAGASCMTSAILGQAVDVTVALDKQVISVGETTTFHVFAQIVPAQRATTDRIFSWYLDLLDSQGGVAALKAVSLTKSTSDNDPEIASSGVTEGANLDGIFDTFIGLAGAGRDARVELLAIPVQGVAPGSATLKVQAGTGLAGIADDFLVAPAGGGDPLVGGNYSLAQIGLQVTGGVAPPQLQIALSENPQTHNAEVTVSFAVTAGVNYFVEFRDSFAAGSSWQTAPGAPQNNGELIEAASQAHRFYRVRVEQ